jgi:hypothetical protein
MKNRLLIVAALLGIFSSLAYAQRDLEQLSQNPRIKQYRIAVFTEVLQLTPEEAQAFWPVYNISIRTELIDKIERRDIESRQGIF